MCSYCNLSCGCASLYISLLLPPFCDSDAMMIAMHSVHTSTIEQFETSVPQDNCIPYTIHTLKNEPDRCMLLHPLRTAMHHQPPNRERTLNHSILMVSGRVFPVLSQIKPQPPLLVVPFHQFREVNTKNIQHIIQIR